MLVYSAEHYTPFRPRTQGPPSVLCGRLKQRVQRELHVALRHRRPGARGLGKLTAQQPRSLGEAGRISGVSPGDVAVLMVFLEKRRREAQG